VLEVRRRRHPGDARSEILESHEIARRTYVRTITHHVVFFGRVITERRHLTTLLLNRAVAAMMNRR
jgi:hypothetical protein